MGGRSCRKTKQQTSVAETQQTKHGSARRPVAGVCKAQTMLQGSQGMLNDTVCRCTAVMS